MSTRTLLSAIDFCQKRDSRGNTFYFIWTVPTRNAKFEGYDKRIKCVDKVALFCYYSFPGEETKR